MAEGGRLSSGEIKRVLSPILPKMKIISKQDVWYIKKQVTKLLPILRDNRDYEDFCIHVNDSVLLNGIDNEDDLDDDEAHDMAKEAWLDILSDESAHGNHLLSLRMYLDLIKENAKGFEYELAVDDEGGLNGAVWQTATMRDNFERFGEYIASDSMFRTINSWNWPYMAISMYNELNMLCLGCEGFMCGERLDAYSFMTHFLIENTPARSPESIDGLYHRLS